MNAQPHAMNHAADPVALNLSVVDRHMREEAVDTDAVMALYTEDAVLEIVDFAKRIPMGQNFHDRGK